MNDLYKMETIDDIVFKEKAIEDILHYREYQHGDPYASLELGHTVNAMSNAIVNYIQRKFNISEDMIKDYQSRYDKQQELPFEVPKKYWNQK